MNDRRRTYSSTGSGGNNIGIESDFVIHISKTDPNPDSMITVSGDPEPLLKGFRRCVMKSTGGNARIMFLKDTDSNFFEDGTPANLTGLDGDVMVYFPEFWYKGTDTDSEWQFNITTTQVNKDNYQEQGWHYAPASLVGVYKAYAENYMLYSKSDVVRSTKLSMEDFSSYARNRGKGYHIIDYQQHCIITWMFYARYKSTNSVSKCGRGSSNLSLKNGSTNSLGITDTPSSLSGDKLINFLGIEGCWGITVECIEGIHCYRGDPLNRNEGIIIYDKGDFHDKSYPDITSQTKRIITNSESGYMVKIEGGTYMDLCAIDASGSGQTHFYCTFESADTEGIHTFTRSNNDTYYRTDNGLTSLENYYGPDGSGAGNQGSRLAFDGEITICKTIEEYRNPPVEDVDFTIVIRKNVSDPASMVSVSGDDPEKLLCRFRRCLAKQTEADKINICYLNDNNSMYYNDNNSTAGLDGREGDVMVYFPEFWYKGEDTSSEWRVRISTKQISGFHHAAASLVGAYKGSTKGSYNYLYSISGDKYTTNSMIQLSAGARAKGSGFHIIDYQQHCIIAWMFYARYKNTNSHSICGEGSDTTNITNGSTNRIGMSDTTPFTASSSGSMLVNFLGIEGCWGCASEYMEGIHSYNGEGIIAYDKGDFQGKPYSSVISSTKRILMSWEDVQTWSGNINKIKGGEYMDMIGTEFDASNHYFNQYFCNNGNIQVYETRIFERAGTNDYRSGSNGVITFYNTNSASNPYPSRCTRLAFDGEIKVIESSSEFKMIG